MTSISTQPIPKSAGIAAAIVFLLHAIFLWSMGQWLWSRDHYQFFPMILIGSLALAWYRLQDAKWPERGSQLTLRVAFYAATSVAVYGLATLTDSNWLGTIAAILLLWTSIWFMGGKSIARRLRGPVFFLLLAIPLPLDLDLQLIIEMQKLASAAASYLLDYKSITHTLSGVAIRTSLKEFMVEEACSGIHSLFSCVTVMVFWAVIFRYGIIRTVLTLIQTIGWVLVANAIRVFCVVFFLHRWNINLESGTPHEVLGLATYASALIFALSTDQLLRFIWPSHFQPFKKDPSLGSYGTAAEASNGLTESIKQWRKSMNSVLDRPRIPSAQSSLIALSAIAVCYVPLAGYTLVQAAMTSAAANQTGANFQASISDLVPESLLPTAVDEWKLVQSRSVNRSPDDPLGTNSVIWTYEGYGLLVNFSLDGFYPSWHDLSYCYTGLGWNLESAENVTDAKSGHVLTKLRLYKDTGEYATSYFSCFDSQNNPVQPAEASGSALRSLLNRLQAGNLTSAAAQSIEPPVYQVQLMTNQTTQLMAHERLQAEQLFSTLRDVVNTQMQRGRRGLSNE